jgi:hypothetical protein
MYNVPKDTTENYISDIVSKHKQEIISILNNLEKQEANKKLYNYLFDKIKTRDYLNIQKVMVKNPQEFKYKVFCNIKVKKHTNKYDLLNEIIEKMSLTFEIESKNIYDLDKNENKEVFFYTNNDEVVYKVMFYGKHLKTPSSIEEMETEVEQILNKIQGEGLIDLCKVQDIDIKVINRFRKSIYYDIENIDFSDDILDSVDKKTLFYNYMEEFNLTNTEEAFINLCFQGYNIYKDEDIIYFQEVLKKKDNQSYSKNYLRNDFFNKLCEKLSENSPFCED